ncbi:MAG: hypothetical protein ACD_56C00057G0009 [uncultured bacterium]|nr:MAG: hypothetical protein ACD_56C00057G0009 [uncultured bacterium]
MKRYILIAVALIFTFPTSLLAALNSVEDVRIAKNGPRGAEATTEVVKKEVMIPAVDVGQLKALEAKVNALTKQVGDNQKVSNDRFAKLAFTNQSTAQYMKVLEDFYDEELKGMKDARVGEKKDLDEKLKKQDAKIDYAVSKADSVWSFLCWTIAALVVLYIFAGFLGYLYQKVR